MIHPVSNQTIVVARGTILIDCTTDSESTATVRSLDLRPIGLMIYGDAARLTFANQSFAGNGFKNTQVMLRMNAKNNLAQKAGT